jgi:hypothetical protein
VTGATVTNTTTGAGTLTFSSNVSTTDGVAGNVIIPPVMPWGGGSAHPGSLFGPLVYGPVLNQANFSALH